MLLERDGELELMTRALAGIDSTGGKIVLIRGEAGIGKSSLVGEFAERHRDETQVHIGSCDDLLVPQPLGPFWDIAAASHLFDRPWRKETAPGCWKPPWLCSRAHCGPACSSSRTPVGGRGNPRRHLV